ncbi:MAG: hypothetical protein JXB88_02025 [Spirochaetales bacterium]|nr:hypothetical protein [Spirochaetales bacterium]
MSNTKKNTLHIKENAKKDIVYHYNRKERLALLHKKPDSRSEKGLFRNKILLIIVCDIILIILIYSIIHIFILKDEKEPDTGAIDMEAYHVQLNGYRIKDKVFARLNIEKVQKTEKEEEQVIVLFFMGTGEPVECEEKLPGTEGDGIKLQATLVCADEKEGLSAQVRIGNKSETLIILPLER